MGVNTSKVNATTETESQIAGARGPVSRRSYIILHTRVGVDCHLLRIDGSAESRVKLSSIFTVAVTKRIVDVFLGSIDTKPLLRDLELFGRVTMRQERQNPYQNPDGCSVHALQAANINGLGVIPELCGTLVRHCFALGPSRPPRRHTQFPK